MSFKLNFPPAALRRIAWKHFLFEVALRGIEFNEIKARVLAITLLLGN